jgi:hypothetical protein
MSDKMDVLKWQLKKNSRESIRLKKIHIFSVSLHFLILIW